MAGPEGEASEEEVEKQQSQKDLYPTPHCYLKEVGGSVLVSAKHDQAPLICESGCPGGNHRGEEGAGGAFCWEVNEPHRSQIGSKSPRLENGG